MSFEMPEWQYICVYVMFLITTLGLSLFVCHVCLLVVSVQNIVTMFIHTLCFAFDRCSYNETLVLFVEVTYIKIGIHVMFRQNSPKIINH